MPPFEIAGATDIGLVRKKNEDNFIICNRSCSLAAVADGIGGHAHGEIASMLCCRGIAERFISGDEFNSAEEAAESLLKWVGEVNSTIFERNKLERNPRPMGTTLCAAIFMDDVVISVNAGDSRLYKLENGTLRKLTRDHTVEQNGAHLLYRAVGITPKIKSDLQILPADAERYVLMSDGIYNSLDEERIAWLLENASSPGSAVETIISHANQNGGVDNLTVIAAFRRS